jgi:hypothetical protein
MEFLDLNCRSLVFLASSISLFACCMAVNWWNSFHLRFFFQGCTEFHLWYNINKYLEVWTDDNCNMDNDDSTCKVAVISRWKTSKTTLELEDITFFKNSAFLLTCSPTLLQTFNSRVFCFKWTLRSEKPFTRCIPSWRKHQKNRFPHSTDEGKNYNSDFWIENLHRWQKVICGKITS